MAGVEGLKKSVEVLGELANLVKEVAADGKVNWEDVKVLPKVPDIIAHAANIPFAELEAEVKDMSLEEAAELVKSVIEAIKKIA